MSHAHRLPLTALALVLAAPLAWLACGGESGESKSPETPASETPKAASSEEPAASDSSSPAASSAPAAEAPAASSAPAAEAPAASSPPPTPSLGSTDCGKCIDKSCSKQAAACGKNSDCQSTLDSIHGCSSSAATCIGAANEPSAAKPKKLAAGYEACAKKAVAKACKAKCQ